MSCAFSGEALATVITFAATNDCPALSNCSLDLLREVLGLALYYDIAGLLAKAERRVTIKADSKPTEACGMVEAVWSSWKAAEFDGGPAGVVAVAALSTIDRWPDEALVSCGKLCEEAMKFALLRRSITADEILFQALKAWAQAKGKERESASGFLFSTGEDVGCIFTGSWFEKWAVAHGRTV